MQRLNIYLADTVKLHIYLFKHHIMKVCGHLHPFLKLAQNEGAWSTLYAVALPLGKNPSTYWIGVWVGLRAGLSAE
jgi:hypothetical protein